MLSFFPRDILDEIWDLIESVSEGFPTYCIFGGGAKKTRHCLICVGPASKTSETYGFLLVQRGPN